MGGGTDTFRGMVAKAKKQRQGESGRFVTLDSGRVIFIPHGQRTKWADVKEKVEAQAREEGGDAGPSMKAAPQPTSQWRADVDEEIEMAFEDDLADRFASVDEYKEWATGKARDLVKTSQGVTVNVPLDRLDEITGDGRLKNAFDEGVAEKFGHIEDHDEYMNVRLELDAQQFGLDIEAPADERAIYGYLLPKDADLSSHVATTYGEAYLHLRPEVEKRSTVTFGDSLDECADNWPKLAPTPLTDPDYQSFSMFSDDNNPLWEDFESVGDLATYAETQIFGGVALSDIRQISIPKGTALESEVQSRLQEAGVDIVEY